MKLAIFGATGKTGRNLVQQGIEKGHDITVLVRDPAKLGAGNPKLAKTAPIVQPAWRARLQ